MDNSFGDGSPGLNGSSILIRRDSGKGQHGKYGSFAREWYTGWSCMKTLVNRGLVVKSSCPARYFLITLPFLTCMTLYINEPSYYIDCDHFCYL